MDTPQQPADSQRAAIISSIREWSRVLIRAKAYEAYKEYLAELKCSAIPTDILVEALYSSKAGNDDTH